MFLKAEFDWVPDLTGPRFYIPDVNKTSINVTISLGYWIYADSSLYCGVKNVIFQRLKSGKCAVFLPFFQGLSFIRTIFFNNNRV